MTNVSRPTPLSRMFTGLTEFTFQAHLGVADPPLTDYLADLLERFIRADAVYGIRNTRGDRLMRIGDMLGEAEARIGEAKRAVHRHIGDFALFWTGVYPEALRHGRGGDGDDLFHDYCQHGKRAYFIASTLPAGDAVPDAGVLERLSEHFEMCAYGLSEVRREWERREGDAAVPLIVQ